MDLLAAVHQRLLERGESVATAESLTGGALAERLTTTPGASTYYRGGVVGYASEVKESLLGVPGALVEAHGVVSAECARAMAAGVRTLLGTTWGSRPRVWPALRSRRARRSARCTSASRARGS